MYRWGSHENHSYLLGIFSNLTKAIDSGRAEEAWRGGKYVYEVIETYVNKKEEYHTIITEKLELCNEGCDIDDCTLHEFFKKNRLKKKYE
jgi:hypothetical protein